MITAAQIRDAYDNIDGSEWDNGAGYSCRFFNLEDEIGVKYYRHKDEAECYFGLQVMFYSLGLAPYAFDFHSVSDGENTYWGFYTEVVEVLNQEKLGWFYEPASNEISKKIAGYGFICGDLMTKNMGIKDGRYIVIDFGCFSYIHHKSGRRTNPLEDYQEALIS